MRQAAVLLGLLTTSALAEPRHFPPGLNSVRITGGVATLQRDGQPPDDAPTLLPPGVFFNEVGYAALEAATLKLQDDLAALEARAPFPTVAVEPPLPPIVVQSGGWSGGAVLLAVVAGVLVGSGATYILTR